MADTDDRRLMPCNLTIKLNRAREIVRDEHPNWTREQVDDGLKALAVVVAKAVEDGHDFELSTSRGL